ncbi:FAD-dependent oxidoreductase [Amycolatopsis suaedae]|uniref:FAD-dependent oxidoreductase n=1 Tax=Amycolatopsis suaedae TaxID=2510978 RepID=A0A4Q7J4L1_9PSEU|nr:FAD-dependent oxidoreductase [Amycolatopsis suaedae]RZQ61947.1 FAD-dependent oxidoreductase [Amycolatopsis suaedae]
MTTSEAAKEHTAVLVVGGGVTGLSAALFLARQGIRPILVERHPDTAILPQARAFNPRTMEIYRALGLEQRIRDRTSLLAGFPEMIGAETLLGEERFRFDLLAQVRPPEGLSPTDWALVDQDDLERILRAEAEDRGADVRFGTELVSLDSGADGVHAVVRDAAGGEYGIDADYVVAADGNRAGIRHRLGIGAERMGPSGHVVYFVFDADLEDALRGRRFTLAYLDRPTKGTVLVPLRTFGRWMLGSPYDPAADQKPEDFTEEHCVALAREAVGDPDLAVSIVPPVPGWSQTVSHSTIGAWVADSYRAGRVFFAGDSAHVMPPSGSYGASTGIADAHNLAWKLAAVIYGQAPDTLLDTYENERRPVAQLTVRTAVQLLHSRQQETGEGIDDITMIFGYRYASDTPLEDPREPSGRPGSRAPHVWLDRDGEKVSTVDLFTGSFTLLAGPDGAGWAAAAAALGLDFHRIGTDPDDRFTRGYGITRSGATLVRPDGFIAWRAATLPELPEERLRQALRHATIGR